MTLPEYLTINGTNYATANLSDTARLQIGNLQVVDAEIARLQQQLAIAQTARNAYVSVLLESVKEKSTDVEEKPKKSRSPRKTSKTSE